MRNRSERLPAIYAASSSDWHDCAPCAPGPLEVYDVTYLHFHDTLEFGSCESGAGICFVEGQPQPFEAGDVQVLFPFQRHLSKSAGPSSSQWHWLNVNPLRVLSEGGGIAVEKMLGEEMALCGILKARDYPELVGLIRSLLYVNSGVQPCNHRLETLCATLQLIILRLSDASRALPKLTLRRSPRLNELSGALEEIDRALALGYTPTVSALSRLSGMSVATLRRLFSASVGQSPQEYINACRMRRAQTLLYATRDSVTDIALSLGYADVSGFNRAFLAHCGLSPSAFRRRAIAQ